MAHAQAARRKAGYMGWTKGNLVLGCTSTLGETFSEFFAKRHRSPNPTTIAAPENAG